MTLDQLRVDSYSTQVSKNELTEIKGGTTPLCVAVWVGIAAIAAYANDQANDHAECETVTSTDQCGNETEIHVCHE